MLVKYPQNRQPEFECPKNQIRSRARLVKGPDQGLAERRGLYQEEMGIRGEKVQQLNLEVTDQFSRNFKRDSEGWEEE